ncbi:EAL domain-containing protein [Rheinheimera fenheensis]|uniref:EAL domain-containing protein n=1 Tax=Rheinheimera fenheensis TaxID=3152295 RepID=UPI00325E74B1
MRRSSQFNALLFLVVAIMLLSLTSGAFYLLNLNSITAATLVTGLVLLPCTLLWMYFSYRLRKQQQSAVAQQQLIITLYDQLELKRTPEQTELQQLAQISQRISHLLKRDQEVRHLVRVQGLIDHELEVGNRVFFESKLQHYLNDHTEPAYGALFLIQVHQPEAGVAGVRQLQRLRGCIDILHGMAAAYTDTVLARLSDNDLVLLVAGLAADDMAKLGDRMAVLLSRASCFIDCADEDVLHIGYAAYQRGQASYQLLSEADMALKTAQLQGQNSAYGVVNQQDKTVARGSVWWRSELSKALQEQRFVLSFQPVMSWQDKDILQHEVLIRLHSTDGTKVPAAVFLPMANNCGLVGLIDQHVLLKAAKLCAVDSRHYSRCSINVSVSSLLDTQWWQWLEQMLLSGQIDPAQLALEVTEHQLLKHYKAAKRVLLKLHKAGFSLIVDQVGLLLETANYVDELPLESVKLHPSVVRNIDQHLEQQLFVRGLIAGYANKGVRVLATGVELEQEWLTLQKLGIAGGQGFYFSQPLNQIITHGQLQ